MTPEELQAALDKLNETARALGFTSAADMASKVPGIMADKQQAIEARDKIATDTEELRKQLQTAAGSFGGEKQKVTLLETEVTELKAQLSAAGTLPPGTTTTKPTVKPVSELTAVERQHIDKAFGTLDEPTRRKLAADPVLKEAFMTEALADTEALPAPDSLFGGVPAGEKTELTPYQLAAEKMRTQLGSPVPGPGPSRRGAAPSGAAPAKRGPLVA